VKTTNESRLASWTATVLLAVLLVLGATLRIANLGGVQGRSPDERVYAMQARALLGGGLAGVRNVVRTYLNDPRLWQYPPPTRVGYMFLVATVMRLTGVEDERAGAYLACAASILSLAMVIPIGLRFLGDWITVFALFFLAAFPAELVIARRCWQDSVLGLAAILLFYLTMQISAGPCDWPRVVSVAAIGSASLLIKETSVLVYGPCLICATWNLAINQREFARAGVLLGAAVVGALAVIALLANCTGGVTVPLTILNGAAHGNATLPYPLKYMTGPGYLLLLGFEALSPVTINLALLGLVTTILPVFFPQVLESFRETRPVTILAALTMGFLTIFMVVPHWLNLRYVSAVYAPVCLFASVAVWRLFLTARQNLRPILLGSLTIFGLVVIAASSAVDYQRFKTSFVRQGANDLSVRLVLAVTRN
jgi:hypothetical protein